MVAPLILTTELADFMGADLDLNRAAQAVMVGTATVRALTGQTLSHVVNDTATVWPVSGLVVLPERPVESVTSVTHDGVPLVDWTLEESGVLRRLGYGYWLAPLVVTYTHGFVDIPAEIMAATLTAAAEAYMNPRGFVSETTGPFSYRLAASGGSSTAVRDLLRAHINPPAVA